MRLSEERTVVATRSISAMRRFGLKCTPARKRWRYSSEADFETHAEERRRFAILNVPRHLFSEATGQAARRAARKKHADPEVS